MQKVIENRCYWGGTWQSYARNQKVRNPANGEVIAEVPWVSAREAEKTISAAHQAQPRWAALTVYERAKFLRRIASYLHENKADLAALLTREQGKPIAESEKEIAYGTSFIEWFAEEGKRVYGETIPATHANKRITVLKQPIGVCAAITPWNFPNAMITRKMAPALAAGCTFILKPAPETPLSAIALAQAAEASGLPAGVFNVITGPAEEIAPVLMRSSRVKKVTFTGSTEVGKLLIQQSAETVKKLTLELGGNAPLLVFEDADLTKAAEGAIFAKYRNAGQTCVCINRILVHRSVAKEFTERLVTISKQLKVGIGSDPSTDIGPLINEQARLKVATLLGDALSKGAVLQCGIATPQTDLFWPPTVINEVTSAMALWHEEIFGPVAAIATFDDEAEAMAMANDTLYGLAAYFYTNDYRRMVRVSEALEYGIVGVNDTQISTAQAPFGGIKQSGYGREGSHFGIDEYLQLKYLSLQL